MSDPHEADAMKRRWWLSLAGIAVVLLLLALGWFTLVEPIRVHREWDRRICADIRQLTRKRPPEVSKGQWEYMVGWTWNMHGNCAAIHGWVEPGWRDEFAAELERRLAGPITVADIDWVWDEYARHTKGGASYSDRYRPTRSDDLPHAQEGCFGLPVD